MRKHSVLGLLKVGFDLDGVLRDQADVCLQWLKSHDLIPETATKEDITAFDFTRCFRGLSPEAVAQMFSEGVLHRARPVLPAIYQLNRLHRAGAEVHVVTHQPFPGDRWHTAGWLRDNGVEYDHLVFVQPEGKACYAEAHGLDMFVEDRFETAIAVAEEVRLSFLVDQPWNQNPDHHDRMRRLYAWHEFGQFCFGS